MRFTPRSSRAVVTALLCGLSLVGCSAAQTSTPGVTATAPVAAATTPASVPSTPTTPEPAAPTEDDDAQGPRNITMSFVNNMGNDHWFEYLQGIHQHPNGDIVANTNISEDDGGTRMIGTIAISEMTGAQRMVELCEDIVELDGMDGTVHRVTVIDDEGFVSATNAMGPNGGSNVCF